MSAFNVPPCPHFTLDRYKNNPYLSQRKQISLADLFCSGYFYCLLYFFGGIFSFSLNCQTPREMRPASDHFFPDPKSLLEETLCSYRGCMSPYSILFYRLIGNRYETDQGSPRAVNKTKVQQFTDKNLLSAKK